jgi:hypothetical protein
MESNMEIGGADIIIDGPRQDNQKVVSVVRGFWPDLVVEECDGTDIFIYKDQKAKDNWDEGIGEDVDADMIYVLPRENQTTVVIDGYRVLMPIADEIRKLMEEKG